MFSSGHLSTRGTTELEILRVSSEALSGRLSPSQPLCEGWSSRPGPSCPGRDLEEESGELLTGPWSEAFNPAAAPTELV